MSVHDIPNIILSRDKIRGALGLGSINLGLSIGMTLKFYYSMAKEFKSQKGLKANSYVCRNSAGKNGSRGLFPHPE